MEMIKQFENLTQLSRFEVANRKLKIKISNIDYCNGLWIVTFIPK